MKNTMSKDLKKKSMLQLYGKQILPIDKKINEQKDREIKTT